MLARLWCILRIKAWWYFRGGARHWGQEWEQDTTCTVEGIIPPDRGITNEPGGIIRIRPIEPRALLATYDAMLRGTYRPRFNAFDALPIGDRDD